MLLPLFLVLPLLATLSGVTAEEPCGVLATSFVPPNGTTKPEVSWQTLSAMPGFVAVRLKRFVAYSPKLKYVSFAFTQQGLMGPADLVIDCYEESTGVVQLATSKNDASHGNTPDAKRNSRLSSVTSSRNQTELECTFVMPIPASTSSYILLATGSMAYGGKQQHSERFVSDRLTIRCEQPDTTTTSGQTRQPESSATAQASSKSTALLFTGGWNVSTSAPDGATPQRLSAKSSGMAQFGQSTPSLIALFCFAIIRLARI